MKVSKSTIYGGAGVLAGAAGVVAYARKVRPGIRHWGATDHEIERTWPSDELLPKETRLETTRAITIDASAEKVWRWVVQIGQDRAGFYSYDWLENLFGLDVHNIMEIVPEFQDRSEGDIVWLAPPGRFGGRARVIVGLLERERMMVMVSPDDADDIALGEEADGGYWAIHVEPVDKRICRLVLRTRAAQNPHFGEKAAQLLFWDLADFIMERKMMKTIKELAEEEQAETD